MTADISKINENLVEQAVLEILQEQGFPFLGPTVIAPDGSAPERSSHGDVLLFGRLETAIAQINPAIPGEARQVALRKIKVAETQSLVEENRRIHALLVNGVDVECQWSSILTHLWPIELTHLLTANLRFSASVDSSHLPA